MVMVKDINIEEIQSTQYSDEVRQGVRYGYLYRKEAEKENGVHHCLPDVPDVFLWFGELILGGIAYDVIKKYAKALWEKLMTMKVDISDDVKLVLIEEAAYS